MKKFMTLILMIICIASLAYAVDPTYGPKVYKDSGGDRQVVASGGTIKVESGGTLNIESGGTFSLTGFAAGKIPVSTFATTVAHYPTSDAMAGNTYRISSVQSVDLPLGSVGMNAVYRTIPGTVTIYPGTNDHWQIATTTYAINSAFQLPGVAGNWVKVVYGAASVWEVYGIVGTYTIP
jgi:hypothetical protein